MPLRATLVSMANGESPTATRAGKMDGLDIKMMHNSSARTASQSVISLILLPGARKFREECPLARNSVALSPPPLLHPNSPPQVVLVSRSTRKTNPETTIRRLLTELWKLVRAPTTSRWYGALVCAVGKERRFE